MEELEEQKEGGEYQIELAKVRKRVQDYNKVDAEGGASAEQVDVEEKKPVANQNLDHVFEVEGTTIYFQLLLILATFHYGMVMINWGDPVVNNTQSTFFANTTAAFVIKSIMLFIGILIYIFSQLCVKDPETNQE
jgi:hypothetical protein